MKILDTHDDIFDGLVTSEVDFNEEEYFEKVLFLN